MTDSSNTHEYNIGDAVLVAFEDAQVPGVIQDTPNGQYVVQLAQPWSDEAGNHSDTATVGPDRLSAYINEETGSQQALPKP